MVVGCDVLRHSREVAVCDVSMPNWQAWPDWAGLHLPLHDSITSPENHLQYA